MSRTRSATLHGNSCRTPVYQTATYFFGSTEEVVEYHRREVMRGRYGRYSNPNWTDVEASLAEADAAEDALVFASGMNAIATTVLALVIPGDTLIYSAACYRNTRTFFADILGTLGVATQAFDTADSAGFEASLDQACRARRPRVVFLEAPSNPHLYLVDIRRIRAMLPEDTILIVDATFGTPVNMKPCRFGADLVLHSCTKYLGGHGDIMGGSAAGRRDLIERVRGYRNVLGGVMSPQSAALLHRSLETLTLRMAHFNSTGLALARHLNASPHVSRVFYTGLDSHPHKALADTYLTGHGGVVSFEVAGDAAATTRFVEALEIPYMGSNFGTSMALVEQCGVFTYYHCTAEERAALGISDQLVRYSVGYEDAPRLIADIEAAFAKTL